MMAKARLITRTRFIAQLTSYEAEILSFVISTGMAQDAPWNGEISRIDEKDSSALCRLSRHCALNDKRR